MKYHVNNTCAKLAPDSILNKQIKEIMCCTGGHRTSPLLAISRANYTSRNTCGIQKMRNIWTLRNTTILGNNWILRNNSILGKTRFSGIQGFCRRPDLTEYHLISSFIIICMWSVYAVVHVYH